MANEIRFYESIAELNDVPYKEGSIYFVKQNDIISL